MGVKGKQYGSKGKSPKYVLYAKKSGQGVGGGGKRN